MMAPISLFIAFCKFCLSMSRDLAEFTIHPTLEITTAVSYHAIINSNIRCCLPLMYKLLNENDYIQFVNQS